MTNLRQMGTLIGLIVIILFFTFRLPETFLTPGNLINISQQVAMLSVVAFTMTVVMVMGDFDLSVGSTASLAGIVAAVLFRDHYPVPLALAAALAVGIAGGLINGALVSYAGILPFVATLGTLTVYSGLAFYISDGATIFGRDIPKAFGDFARHGLPVMGLKLPYLTLVATLVLILTWVLLEHTTYGRRLYAIGGNRQAAHLAGLRVNRLRLSAFAITGLGAGLMLDAIAAVFLGMTMGRQGEPHVLATLVGVLILGILDNGLTQMQVDSYVREMLVGSIVIAAVAISSFGRDKG